MILPSKHIELNSSLLAVGGLLLQALNRPRTITSLWEEVGKKPYIGTFEKFSLGLSFLYTIGAIELNQGLLRRYSDDSFR